jgi:SNF2 family DNA or RNA helicase
MTLATTWDSSFSAKDKRRGREYFDGGNVESLRTDRDAVAAQVRGSESDPYFVIIPLTKGAANFSQASCDCPRFDDGYACKHLWAVLLTIDNLGPQALKPGFKWKNEEADDGYDDYGYDDGFDDERYEDDGNRAVGPGPNRNQRGKSAPRKKSAASHWRKQLQQISEQYAARPGGSDDLWAQSEAKQREVWYALNVSASMSRGRLVVDLYQRETKKNGEWGKFKQLPASRESCRDFPLAADRHALALLTGNEMTGNYGYGYGYYGYGYNPASTTIAIASGLYEAVLPALAATGRFVWLLDAPLEVADGRPVAWDDGPPWQLRLQVNNDPRAKCWRLTGRLIRGAESADLSQPVLLLSSGLVLWEDRLARLAAEADFAWLAVLRQHGEIVIPHADRDALIEQLWQRSQAPSVELPPDLQWPQISAAPRGWLQVLKDSQQFAYRPSSDLYAKVQFEYEGEALELDDARTAIVDAAGQRILLRDRDAERSLLAQLRELKIRRSEDRYVLPEANAKFPRAKFADIVAQLAQTGWRVEAEGKLIRSAGEFNITVTSGIDWFDLDVVLDFDGVAAKLPDLLAALKRGEKFIRLGDGSQGMLPEEWLEKYGQLAQMGEVEEGKLRFRPTQAMLLDALLAAQGNVTVDRDFQKFREKLKRFAGVASATAPRSFQGELREYQKQGLGWLHFLREFQFGGCLADDMGLGKTIQVLALLDARRTRRVEAKAGRNSSLVVVPKSLIFNWVEEAARFTPKLRVLNYTGLGRRETAENFAEHDVILTTYGTLRRDIALLKDVRFDYAILDEAQAIKNAASQSAKACRLIQADHRLAMTGTPVENHLGELWSLLEFLNPGMLGKSSAVHALTKGASDGDTASLDLLRRGLAPFILRRTKEQVLSELPEKTEQTLHCEMDKQQRKEYDELREYYRALLQKRIAEVGMQKAKIHVLEALLRLRQAACHPGLLNEKKINGPSAKLETLLEQLDEILAEGHKALVFSQFTSLLAIVRARLDERQIPYEYLDGRTRDRQQRVERFQNDPACPLFLISLKAGGQGLNLTAADYVFILDPWWNPAVEAQAVDRAHRIGQTRRVFAYRLICRDTVEEKIIQLQQRKRDLADAIISADSSLMRSLTAEDLQLLLG